MILDQLAQQSAKRVAREKQAVPIDEIKERALSCNCNTGFPFERALKKSGISYICEVKKASPSKGIIAEQFPYLEIARDYEQAGAAAVSVLTEPLFFLGSDRYLKEIAGELTIPILRKDFTVDAYQIYQAKALGAHAVLLICALLGSDTLKKYIKICDALGLSALVEAHTPQEIRSAVNAGARMVGVNNRNLKTFEVDAQNCIKLRGMVPDNVLFIAESGIKTSRDVALLRKAGADAVLIGETLMKSPNKKAKLASLNGGPVK